MNLWWKINMRWKINSKRLLSYILKINTVPHDKMYFHWYLYKKGTYVRMHIKGKMLVQSIYSDEIIIGLNNFLFLIRTTRNFQWKLRKVIWCMNIRIIGNLCIWNFFLTRCFEAYERFFEVNDALNYFLGMSFK